MTKKLKDSVIVDEMQKQGLLKAQEEEIRLVLEDLKAMEPVKREEIPRGFKVHNTHLFTVEKFTTDGSHEKYKSRLVAHGNEQDSMVYAD